MLKTGDGSKQQFAERVKTLRAELSMSAVALAKTAEVSPASVWQWENAGAVPRKSTLSKLAMALGVSPDYLVAGAAAASPAPARIKKQSGALSEVTLEDLVKAIQARGFQVTLSTRL